MKITEKKKGQVVVLYVSERLDTITAPELDKKLMELIEAGEQNLLLNFESLSYISSSGLRVLLGAAKKIKAKKGKFLLCSLGDMIRRVIEMAGFDKILSLHGSEDEALKQF